LGSILILLGARLTLELIFDLGNDNSINEPINIYIYDDKNSNAENKYEVYVKNTDDDFYTLTELDNGYNSKFYFDLRYDVFITYEQFKLIEIAYNDGTIMFIYPIDYGKDAKYIINNTYIHHCIQ